MIAKLQFKARFTTEELYPSGISIEFTREVTDSTDVFNGVYDFIKSIVKMKIVSCSTECLGYYWISNAEDYEINNLERNGINRINYQNY